MDTPPLEQLVSYRNPNGITAGISASQREGQFPYAFAKTCCYETNYDITPTFGWTLQVALFHLSPHKRTFYPPPFPPITFVLRVQLCSFLFRHSSDIWQELRITKPISMRSACNSLVLCPYIATNVKIKISQTYKLTSKLVDVKKILMFIFYPGC